MKLDIKQSLKKAFKFNENGGTSPANSGTLSGSFTSTATTPTWSTNVTATVGETSSLDFWYHKW